jgi:hypothetical protein
VYGYSLVVLSPRVIALGAAKEPDLTFISGTELAEPPDRKIICALGTLDLDGRHSLYLTFLFNNDNFIHQSSGYTRISGISTGLPKKLTYFYIQDRTSV